MFGLFEITMPLYFRIDMDRLASIQPTVSYQGKVKYTYLLDTKEVEGRVNVPFTAIPLVSGILRKAGATVSLGNPKSTLYNWLFT